MKIAHISDPHLTTLRHVGWPELLNKRILGYLSWRYRRRHVHKREMLERLLSLIGRENPDLLVVTGDLTHIGTPGECRQARDWLAATARSFDIALVPGNHDCYIRADYGSTIGLWARYFPGERYFPGRALNGRDGQDDRQAAFPTVRRMNGIALIGVNTARPAPPFHATGEVGARQRAAVAEALRQTGEDGLFRLALMHHGPVVGTYGERRRLLDEAEFTDLIQRQGAEMILHGHGHKMTDGCIVADGRRIPVSGVAAATATTAGGHPPAGYKLYDIDRAQSGWSVRCRAVSMDGDGRGHERGAGRTEERRHWIPAPAAATGERP